MPHEIAVCEDTQQLVIVAGHNGSTRSDARHGLEHVADGRIGRDNRHSFARPHDLMNAH